MAIDRLIHIVKGYHQDTPVPRFAIEQNLGNRFAVILDPFHSDIKDTDFDVELMLAILGAISSVVDYDTFLVEFDDNTQCTSLVKLCEMLRAMSGEALIAPRRILWRKRGAYTCLEETEFWALCGGPAPYSDSYTLSFYTVDDLGESFETACSIACKQIGSKVGDIIQASYKPIETKFWNHACKKLFGCLMWKQSDRHKIRDR